MHKLRTQMRWIMILIVLAFLLSTFLMYGSGSRRGGSTSGQSQFEDRPVAEVNGKKIMLSTLNLRVRDMYERMGTRDIASVDLPLLYQTALRDFVMDYQLAQEVKESGITVSNAEGEQAVKDHMDKNYPTRETFYQELERAGTNLADYTKEVTQQMAAERYMTSVIGDLTVSEDEAVKFYDTTKELFFKQPSGFKVSIASFVSEDIAERVRVLLLGGQDWATATSGDHVAEFFLNTTTEPVFVTDDMFETTLLRAKELEIGAVSSVFEIASNDFAVLVKNERVEETVTPYENVSADIRSIVGQQKQREAINRFTEGLMNRAKLVILDESIFPSAKPENLPVVISQDEQVKDVVSEEPVTESASSQAVSSENSANTELASEDSVSEDKQ